MDNVVPFPTRFELNWQGIKDVLDNALRKHDVDDEMRQALLARMHSYYNKTARDLGVSFTLPMPGNMTLAQNEAITKPIESAFAELFSKFSRLMNEMLAERFLLEVAIYQSGMPPPENAAP